MVERYTRQTQNLLLGRACGFESHRSYHSSAPAAAFGGTLDSACRHSMLLFELDHRLSHERKIAVRLLRSTYRIGAGGFFSWALSSVGQSTRLITGWSWVQVPESPPFRRKDAKERRLVPSFYIHCRRDRHNIPCRTL